MAGNELTEEAMKMAAQEFDVEGITKLSCTHKGLVRVAAVGKAVHLTELNLSHNLIDTFGSCLLPLQRLKKLHLTANKLRCLDGGL
jgi:Leucine-rich repeat (LRR) protein